MNNKKPKWLERATTVSPYLALCGSKKEFADTLAHLKVKDAPPFVMKDATTHTFNSDGNTACVVCFSFEDAANHQLVECIGLLIHEATHVWQQMRDDMGEKNPSSEFEAYSMQAIAQRLIEDFMLRGKWKGKGKRK